MELTGKNEKYAKIFSKQYWRDAAAQTHDAKMITLAALIVALRIVVKLFKIPIAAGLSITLDAYVNSLGSIVYGPVMGLFVGLISDSLGQVLTGKMHEFFPPYAIIEMTSSFIFGLFFWRRKITISRALWAKFTVNLVCNIIMTSIVTKWMYAVFYGVERAEAYNLINGVRIVKNLVLFPLEAMIILIVLSAAVPVLSHLGLVDRHFCFVDTPRSKKRTAIYIMLLSVFSVALVVLYVLFLKDFVSDLGIKLL